jgi:threonine/homoserine/homoserine lactone efflux protein
MPVDPSMLAAFLAFSAVVSAVPGPSVVLATSRAITHGRGTGLRIVAGNFLGGLVLVTCAIAGLGALLAASAGLFEAVRWLGVGYLVYLGCRALAGARRTTALTTTVPDTVGPGSAGSVRKGLLVGLSNPKSLVTLTAILPQFVDPALGSVPVQMALIGLAGGLAQVLIECCWVAAGARLRSWFLGRPQRLRALNATGGFAMLGLAGRVAMQRPAQ